MESGYNTIVATASGWPSDAKKIQPWDVRMGAVIPFLGLPAWHLMGHQEGDRDLANPPLPPHPVSGVTGETDKVPEERKGSVEGEKQGPFK